MSIQERLFQKITTEELKSSQRRIRILPDGRHVSTFEGLKHAPESIEKNRAAHVGKRRKDEDVHRSSYVWNQVRPFFQEDLPIKI